ncbi:MAG: hypothetical protein HKN28_14560 [Alphaproteobacteria bacterium]|nr:hypothetical protein [Alphaproteobacteria bacterium]
MFMHSTRTARTTLGGFMVVLAMLTSIAFASGTAHAQSGCEARKSLIEKFDKGYGESPIAVGLASTGNLLEVLISADGTWTILITRPDGMTCIAAAGDHWRMIEKLKVAGKNR